MIKDHYSSPFMCTLPLLAWVVINRCRSWVELGRPPNVGPHTPLLGTPRSKWKFMGGFLTNLVFFCGIRVIYGHFFGSRFWEDPPPHVRKKFPNNPVLFWGRTLAFCEKANLWIYIQRMSDLLKDDRDLKQASNWTKHFVGKQAAASSISILFYKFYSTFCCSSQLNV